MKTMSNFMKAIREYNQQKQMMKDIETLKNNGLWGNFVVSNRNGQMMIENANIPTEYVPTGDTRYNVPKSEPKVSEELVEETILATEIYRRARLAVIQSNILNGDTRTAILEAQRKQVGYGLDKYPEPLNPNTWTITETVEHIMDESIDRLHYLVMLRIKLEQLLVNGAFNDILEVRNTNTRIVTITRMVDNTIEELHYLVNLCILTDRETEAAPNDAMDAMAYSLKVMKDIGVNLTEGLSDSQLFQAGADLDGDMIQYCKADVEATKKFYDELPIEHSKMYPNREED
jgi:hypothetical protein